MQILYHSLHILQENHDIPREISIKTVFTLFERVILIGHFASLRASESNTERRLNDPLKQ